MSSQALAVLESGPRDLYYSDEKSCLVQSVPVQYNTRFAIDFSNKGSGQSSFLVPPSNGLRTPVIVLGYRANTLAGNNGRFALPRGWCYEAVESISWRVGSSSQYFMTGHQLLEKNVSAVRTREQANAIVSLGGNACTSTEFSSDQFGYIPLSCLTAPSADGMTLPIPTDILNQPIQFTVTIKNPSAWWVENPNAGGLVGNIPVAFDVAYMQFEQLVMMDRAQSLANNAAFASGANSYNMPVVFDQQEQIIGNLTATTSTQMVNLNGFRSGQLTSIEAWLEDSRASNLSRLNWHKPKTARVIYAGVILADYRDGSSAIWNLIDGTKPSAVDQVALSSIGAGLPLATTPFVSEYVSLPFAQKTGDDYSDEVLVAGTNITNGTLQLDLGLPDATATGGPGTPSIYQLHVVYRYGSVALNFQAGGAEYVF